MLRQLNTPTLAVFGELDNNIVAQKNNAAWQAALVAAGNGDYTLRILPKTNHMLFEATVGSNAETRRCAGSLEQSRWTPINTQLEELEAVLRR